MKRRVKVVTSVHLNFEHVLFAHPGWVAGDSHTQRRDVSEEVENRQ